MEQAYIVMGVMSVLVAVVFGYFRKVYSQEINKTWRRVATALDLVFRTHPQRLIQGEYEGMAVQVRTIAHRSMDGHIMRETEYRVSYPHLGLGLELTREGLFDGVGKALGWQDIEVGDERFDDSFLIKGDDPDEIRRFLTPARRMRIKRLFSMCKGSCTVSDRGILLLRDGFDGDEKEIVTTIHLLVRAARHLIEERSDDRCLDEAIAAQEDGELEAALSRLRSVTCEPASSPGLSLLEVPPPRTAAPPRQALATGGRGADGDSSGADMPVEELVMEGELLYLAKDYAEAARVFERAHFMSPFDEEIAGWHKLARKKLVGEPVDDDELPQGSSGGRAAEGDTSAGAGEVPDLETGAHASASDAEGGPGGGGGSLGDAGGDVPADSRAEGEPPRSSEASAKAPAPSDLDLSPEGVCAALFPPGRSGLEVSGVFEESYEGRTVHWEGVLRKVEPYKFDLLFGRRPGTKAVVDIAELGGDGPFGEKTVKAVVQLPEDAAGALRDRKEDVVRFEGRLLRVDGLLRNLYVGSGALID